MARTERHYTNADDWVILNKKITHTACRVYLLAKGRTKHETMAFPEHGFRATAEWFVQIMDGMFSTKTVREALRNLVENGALRRTNINTKDGGGGEYEFVVDPGQDYEGFLSVFDKEKSTKMPPHATFREVSLSEDPTATGDRFRSTEKVNRGTGKGIRERPRRVKGPEESVMIPAIEAPPLESMASAAVQEEPEFDLSGLDTPMTVKPNVPTATSGPAADFAGALEEFTAGLTDPKLRLMPGQCKRIADAAAPVLALGWQPRVLAKRLAAELNSHIRMPEQLLIGKIPDLGAPPKATKSAAPQAHEVAVPAGFVPKRNGFVIPRREGREVLSPEEQQKAAELMRKLAAERAGDKRRRFGNP
jgi:hypothetical protein